MKRKEIKEKAQKMIDGKLWEIWKPLLLIMLISMTISFMLDKVFILAYSYDFLSINGTSMAIDFSNTVTTFIMAPIGIGYTFYILNFVRGKKFSINDIFSKIKYILPIWAATFIASTLIGVGFIFLIVPGIVISMIFAMIEYIMADGEHNVAETLRQSKELMIGYKWDYFVFNLSFIGWIILSIITIGILSIYTIPYMTVSKALYYEELKKLKEAKYKILINKANKCSANFKIVNYDSKYDKKGQTQILLEEKTAEAFKKLVEFVKNNGYTIDADSGFRSKEEQHKTYEETKKEKGPEYAAKYVAPSGYSEHQSGLAVDFCQYKDDKWLDCNETDLNLLKIIHENAARFGFILRYPKDKEKITGYKYEAWHLRYVGDDLALYLYKNNLTLEEYHEKLQSAEATK